MKRKILAVLLMMVLSMACVACEMEEAVETGSSNAVVSMENEVAKAEAPSTPMPSPTVAPTATEIPTNSPTPMVVPSPTELPTSTQSPTLVPTSTPTPTVIPSPTELPTPTIAPTPTERPTVDVMVWLPATGEKYHSKNNCGRMNPSKARQVTKSEAERRGYEPCSKCY